MGERDGGNSELRKKRVNTRRKQQKKVSESVRGKKRKKAIGHTETRNLDLGLCCFPSLALFSITSAYICAKFQQHHAQNILHRMYPRLIGCISRYKSRMQLTRCIPTVDNCNKRRKRLSPTQEAVKYMWQIMATTSFLTIGSVGYFLVK